MELVEELGGGRGAVYRTIRTVIVKLLWRLHSFKKTLVILPIIVFLLVSAPSRCLGQEDFLLLTVPGANIQRTMSLLAESSPTKRNPVKVLFYGQSITAQDWWKQVADDLRYRFPYADLEVLNLAIGGYQAPRLVLTAEYDLYPTQPDLLIFHVYGGDQEGSMDRFEDIIRRTRKRTTAEIVLWTSHDVNRDRDYRENLRIRELAVKYQCGLIDVEASWQKVLADKQVSFTEYIRDAVHLNEKGCDLMAELVSRFLIYDPELMHEKSLRLSEDMTLEDSRVTKLANGSMEVRFEGSRLDLITEDSNGSEVTIGVSIDGNAPSRTAGLIQFTRPSLAPYESVRPALRILRHQAPLIEEMWTLTILACNDDASRIRFRVSGSVTGFDGEGTSMEDFVSNSGRIAIPRGKSNWGGIGFGLTYRSETGPRPLPKDFKITWKAYALVKDTIRLPAPDKSGHRGRFTLVQGISNSEHIIKLIPIDGEIAPSISYFRVYSPPYK